MERTNRMPQARDLLQRALDIRSVSPQLTRVLTTAPNLRGLNISSVPSLYWLDVRSVSTQTHVEAVSATSLLHGNPTERVFLTGTNLNRGPLALCIIINTRAALGYGPTCYDVKRWRRPCLCQATCRISLQCPAMSCAGELVIQGKSLRIHSPWCFVYASCGGGHDVDVPYGKHSS